MKIIFALFTLLSFFTFSINAQIDQISVGAGYSQQAYYSLSTGSLEVVDNDAWDISFSALGGQDAGLFINESVSFMGTPLQVFLSNETDWSAIISDTEAFVDSVALHNPEADWSEGAYNTVKDPSSPFDYGWGEYNPQTHVIEGNRIFVIKKRNGTFLKMQVVSLASGVYTIKYAALDGSNESIQEIDKSEANNGMVYFSFETENTVEMPTEYDLIFQRYTTPLDAGDDTQIQYTVTGVLLANGVEAVVVDGIDPTNINEAEYTDQYSSLPTTIGHTWKSFDFAVGWVIDEDRTHFVKTSDGEVYQVTFFDFEGSGTGITTLEKTSLGMVSTNDNMPNEFDLVIFPNPTSDHLIISADEDHDITITIIDNAGRRVASIICRTNESISLRELATGQYNMHIQSPAFTTTKRIVVR